MSWFKKKEETALIDKENPVVIAVPDIKEYLVNEYEKVEKQRNLHGFINPSPMLCIKFGKEQTK